MRQRTEGVIAIITRCGVSCCSFAQMREGTKERVGGGGLGNESSPLTPVIRELVLEMESLSATQSLSTFEQEIMSQALATRRVPTAD